MHSQLSTKLAALALALTMNSLLLGGVAVLFNSQAHQPTNAISLAHTEINSSGASEAASYGAA